MDDIVHMKQHSYPRRKQRIQTKPVCLEVFLATGDAEGEKDAPYRCGLPEGHEGGHAWRGDLPGGPVT